MNDKQSSPYILGEPHEDKIDGIFKELNKGRVAEELKAALSSFCDDALDSVTDYIEDEYVLRLEDIALKKAEEIVNHLLKGKDLQSFGLKVSPDTWGLGCEFAFDPYKIRASIVKDFAEDIQNAEILTLKKENESLRKTIDILKGDY